MPTMKGVGNPLQIPDDNPKLQSAKKRMTEVVSSKTIDESDESDISQFNADKFNSLTMSPEARKIFNDSALTPNIEIVPEEALSSGRQSAQ